jgi:membrane protein DedA with SNARE-associated domain
VIHFLEILFELVISSPTPIRVLVAMLPGTLLGAAAYWFLPNRTLGARIWVAAVLLGLVLGIWWHVRERKYDRPV